MIYDFVLGRALSNVKGTSTGYISNIYTNRLDVDDIKDYKELVSLISVNLDEAFKKVDSVTANVDNIISEFAILKDMLIKGKAVDDIDITIRELLASLAYEGYELFVIRRQDLNDTVMDVSTRAYLFDKHDTYFPSIDRVVNGYSIKFQTPEEADIATVSMQFLSDMSLSDIAMNTINAKALKQSYDILEKAKMGWTLDVRPLITFIENLGYRIIVSM